MATRLISPPAPSRRLALSCALVLGLAGCAVGPNYHRPTVATPEAFKEAAGWKQASPDDAAPRGAWWEAFHDPVLNEYEAELASNNFSLLAAVAAYDEAREVARADRASFLPFVTANGSADRSRSGATTATSVPSTGNLFNGNLQASWQPDFFGKIRRQTEADVAAAQASAANVANVRLALQSELAQDYIGLRVSDELHRLLTDAATAYERTLVISRNKYGVGVSAKSDVLSAEAQLDATRAQEVNTGVQRAEYEHAIAILLGRPPSGFSIAPRASLDLPIPGVPQVVPSELLERRPDIAEAERAMAEANAKVGVETAAYFPDLSLTAEGGFENVVWHRLFDYPSRFWSLGGNASETLFDWGARRAELKEAEAAYDQTVASYRGAVLSAFQQVEDNLASQRILAEEASIQETAVAESAQATQIAQNEYLAGTADYTTVATAEVSELSDREQALTTNADRLTASVSLMVALGGGWQTSDLPTRGDLMTRRDPAPETVAAPVK